MLALVGCHQHTFESEWSSNAQQHWHASTCHDGEKADVDTHTFVENASGNLECVVCGYEQIESSGECEVAFAYYSVDDDGNPITDEDGAYVEIGVTYTSVQKEGSVEVDTINGATLTVGDKVSFTVKKSVFCYYNDQADSPLVEIISGETGSRTREEIYPDEDGVYTVTINGDTIISVANVSTSPRTITGSGTEDDPFTINSLVDWLYFATYVNDKSYYSLVYNIGYWVLTTDLDFEGESIYMIGDGYSSGSSVFCGNFDGGGHTLSNFVLDNELSTTVGTGYSSYLGLFGVSTGYVGVDSVIANLKVKDVTINATADSDSIVCAGSILGYGVGANVVNCEASNVKINVVADDTYMSFAGGIVGYMQSGMTDDGMLFYSSVSYCVADDVTIKGNGMLYSAGGIVGRLVSYSEQVTSFVINSYSINCDVADAVRAGGIAGDIQRYSSIQNCYSTSSVSAYSSIKTSVDETFVGTLYDDRYAYAGGIVGYAENDTAVVGCFFDGEAFASALAGSNYAKKGNIVAGYSAANYADYYASGVVLDNQADGVSVDNDYLKNTLGWNSADWTFGEGYPTINQDSNSLIFTVTINVDGQVVDTIEINSQYIPLSYWYILQSDTIDAIQRYYSDGTNRTYGYYFDEQLTKVVPVGYVPMKDITLYASYADTTPIAGTYFVSNDGVSANITISTDGTYTYEEGAVYLVGSYRFDGEIITFENSYFSRLATSATSTQKASYYTFWAKLQQNGDLHLYDCDTIFEITEDTEEQNSAFTAMARFYPVDSPLTLVSSNNLSITGGYYYTNNDTKHVFVFNNDFTGTYKKYSGSDVVQDTFNVSEDGASFVITLDANGTQYIASVEGGKLATIQDNRGNSYDLSQVDAFAGTWEKSATTHKLYTFDGMGNWSYEHYFYLNSDELATAIKQVVESANGTYTLDMDGNLTFTRDSISVVASVKDGKIVVSENGEPVQVEFAAQNSFMGVWYTASNKIVRYTLTLEGLNQKGVGMATLDGFNTAPLELRYVAVSSDTLWLYINDIVYAVLEYSPKTGLMEGLFYDNTTASTTTPQTLYLYDDFKGAWVSDVEGLENIKFNGFGAYNTTDATGNTLAVKGIVTIGNTNVGYTIDAQTGNAQFTYKSVEYTLSYNEYTNTILVSYEGGNGIIAKADDYQSIVLYNGDATYTFDGRGHLSSGGIVTKNGTSGTYTIDANGNLVMSFEGESEQTIGVSASGYTIGDAVLYVDNAFSGTWAIPGKNISIVVGNFTTWSQDGQTVAVAGSINGEEVTMYFNGVDTITFEHGAKKYTLTQVLEGKAPALLFTEMIAEGEEVLYETIAVVQDDFFGVWTSTTNANAKLTFDGTGASAYVSGGQVSHQISQGTVYSSCTYKIVDGVVTIYHQDGNTYEFVECNSTDQNAFTNGSKYYKLEIK